MANDDKRVVVTGLGAVTCLGNDVNTYWKRIIAGESGIDAISKYDASAFRCRVAGEVRDFDISEYMPAKEGKRLDPFCHYAIAAADEAMAQSGLSADNTDPTRIGTYIGSGIGGIKTLDTQAEILYSKGPSKSSPLMVPKMIIDMASGIVSIRHGLQGPNLGMVTACASGGHAIGEAAWVIKRGDADAVVTGGAEAIIEPLGLTGFCAMKALTEHNEEPQKASRPFDKNRDGFIPSEGAGIFVLESLANAKRRGAEILAEVVGYGLSGDAYHITAPHPEAEGARLAIRNALKGAAIAPEEIGYINAHGTSTQLNDKMETDAIKKVFGPAAAYKVPISSTKSMIGHTIGAAGGLESIACVQTLNSRIAPPTINYETPDPGCDLDYIPNAAREMDVEYAMNINLGFGGHNAALVFKKRP